MACRWHAGPVRCCAACCGACAAHGTGKWRAVGRRVSAAAGHLVHDQDLVGVADSDQPARPPRSVGGIPWAEITSCDGRRHCDRDTSEAALPTTSREAQDADRVGLAGGRPHVTVLNVHPREVSVNGEWGEGAGGRSACGR